MSKQHDSLMRYFRKDGYHENGNRGASRRHPALPPNTLAVGIELEMEHLDGYHQIFESFPVAQRIEDIPWFESDGSLNSSQGVEIVWPPLPVDVIRDPSSLFGGFMANIEQDNRVANSGRAGMHVNVNVTGMTTEQKATFIATSWGLTNEQCRAIGGRWPNNYCSSEAHATISSLLARAPEKYNRARIRLSGSALGEAAWAAATCVEVRFPASTKNRAELDRVLTYIEAAWTASFDPEYVEACLNNLTNQRTFPILMHYARTQISNPIFSNFITRMEGIQYDTSVPNPFDSSTQSSVRGSEDAARIPTPEELDELWSAQLNLAALGSTSQIRRRAEDAYERSYRIWLEAFEAEQERAAA